MIFNAFAFRGALIELFHILKGDKKKSCGRKIYAWVGKWEISFCPSLSFWLHLNSGLVERVRDRTIDPTAHQIHHHARGCLIMRLSAADVHAAAAMLVEISRNARRTQLKRSPLIKVFLRSAKVLRGFSPWSNAGQFLGPAAALSFLSFSFFSPLMSESLKEAHRRITWNLKR